MRKRQAMSMGHVNSEEVHTSTCFSAPSPCSWLLSSQGHKTGHYSRHNSKAAKSGSLSASTPGLCFPLHVLTSFLAPMLNPVGYEPPGCNPNLPMIRPLPGRVRQEGGLGTVGGHELSTYMASANVNLHGPFHLQLYIDREVHSPGHVT